MSTDDFVLHQKFRQDNGERIGSNANGGREKMMDALQG